MATCVSPLFGVREDPLHRQVVALRRLEDPSLTGSTIFFAAAQEIRGIWASSILGTMASVLPEVLGPTIATTRSRLRSRSTAVTALVASLSSS